MAKSFGCTEDDANELVQEMYVRITKYVKDGERIMYNDKEVNTFYVYITLRNLFLSKFHTHKYQNYGVLDDLRFEDGREEIERKTALEKIISSVEQEVKDWYWYDKKMWEIHFYDQMSMRKISSHTSISLSSIFTTLKKCKNRVKEIFYEDVEDYKNGDYDRI